MRQINTQIFYNYKIETEESDKIIARVYNLRAIKDWKSLKYNYRFSSLEQREKWLSDFMKNVKSHEDYIAEQKTKRLSFVNPAKVGDILYSSWGYDQTNIDFYQVVEVKNKQIVIRQIHGKNTGYDSSMSGKVTAVKDSFIESEEPLTKLVQPNYSEDGYFVTLNSYANAWEWDGKDKSYSTWG